MMRRMLSLLFVVGGMAAGCATDEAALDDSTVAEGEALDPDSLEERRWGGRPHPGGGAMDGGIVPDAGRPVHFASAKLAPKSGNTTLGGKAVFAKRRGKVQLTLWVEGAPPGKHGAHLHAVGDCSAPDAASAGGHWNPTQAPHGAPSTPSHLGDLGNITIGRSGRGLLTFENPAWTLGDGAPTDVLNHAIVIHADPDDLTSQPSGNAGGRIGCGVVEAD